MTGIKGKRLLFYSLLFIESSSFYLFITYTNTFLYHPFHYLQNEHHHPFPSLTSYQSIFPKVVRRRRWCWVSPKRSSTPSAPATAQTSSASSQQRRRQEGQSRRFIELVLIRVTHSHFASHPFHHSFTHHSLIHSSSTRYIV